MDTANTKEEGLVLLGTTANNAVDIEDPAAVSVHPVARHECSRKEGLVDRHAQRSL